MEVGLVGMVAVVPSDCEAHEPRGSRPGGRLISLQGRASPCRLTGSKAALTVNINFFRLIYSVLHFLALNKKASRRRDHEATWPDGFPFGLDGYLVTRRRSGICTIRQMYLHCGTT